MNSDFNIAVHALVYLSHKAQTLSSQALAENICANPARVRKVLAKLSRAGLIQTREGRSHGGCSLARPAQTINLRQVGDAVDTCFVSTRWKSGDPNMECLVASGMSSLLDHLYSQLDERCKAHLSQLTVWDLEQEIFHPAQPVAPDLRTFALKKESDTGL